MIPHLVRRQSASLLNTPDLTKMKLLSGSGGLLVYKNHSLKCSSGCSSSPVLTEISTSQKSKKFIQGSIKKRELKLYVSEEYKLFLCNHGSLSNYGFQDSGFKAMKYICWE